MFEICRRGFLKSAIVAAVGALATFDTGRKLWLPDSHLEVRDEVLELNDLALRFAKKMAERMADERAHRVVLSQLLFERGTRMENGIIRLEQDNRAIYFEPLHHRIVKTGDATNQATLLDMALGQTMQDVRRNNVTAFAPINAKMRHGSDFADATVGLATDPVSGLSARSLRFKNTDGQLLTSLELAVGTWEPAMVRPKDYAARPLGSAGYY